MSHANQIPKRNKIEIIIPKDKEFKRKTPLYYIGFILILIIGSGILAFFNVNLNLKIQDLEGQDTTEIVIESGSSIELSDNQEIKTEIETEDGEIEVLSLPVVDSVDGGEILDADFDADKDGQGANYNIETPQAFTKDTIGQCITMGNKFGAQCVSLARAFWESYTPRSFSTCGTGMAKGAWNCKEQNAGSEFKLIDDKKDLKAGDWLIFDGGRYGHVGMALGEPNKGYISLLGENQGGTACAGGGSATNIINISLKNFVGAFRPKIYDVPKVPDTGFVPNI